MILLGGLFHRSPVYMKKENDRKIGLRYNGDMDSFDERKVDQEWKAVSVIWHIRIKKTI